MHDGPPIVVIVIVIVSVTSVSVVVLVGSVDPDPAGPVVAEISVLSESASEAALPVGLEAS